MLDLSPDALEMVRRLLVRHVPGAEVWAYGSRVTGEAHGGSDLDLVVRDATDQRGSSSGLPGLRDALAESDLAILVDVLDWAQIPEEFRRQIESRHVVVQRAGERSSASGGREHG